MAAAKDKKIAGVGLIATPGTTYADVALAQQKRALDRLTLTPEERQAKVDEQKKIHEAVITGKGLELLPPNVRRSVDNGEYQSLLVTDPAKVMSNVRQPLLIVQGSLDTQVEPGNADVLDGARAQAQERAGGRGREGAWRQSPAGPGDQRRGQRVRRHQGQEGQQCGHRGNRDVAEQDALGRALDLARGYAGSRSGRPVWATATLQELRTALGGPLQAAPIDPTAVIDALARAAEPGLVTTTGPRYFGFVTGGALPATVAAEWLAAVWDQPAALYVMSPAAAVVEEVAAAWLIDLLGLPSGCSVGFVTGCHMANFTALAAARHELLRRAGWDVEADGLQGAPRLRVIVGDEVHVSVIGALRMLGIGSQQIVRVAADEQGRMKPDALAEALEP